MTNIPSGDSTEEMRREFETWFHDGGEEEHEKQYLYQIWRDSWQAAIASKQEELRLYKHEQHENQLDLLEQLAQANTTIAGLEAAARFWQNKAGGMSEELINIQRTFDELLSINTALREEYHADIPTLKHISSLEYSLSQANATIAALQAKIEEADGQKPFGYWHQGDSIDESDFLLYTDVPNSDEDCTHCKALFTRPPITSECELALLGIIEQMREALVCAKPHLDIYSKAMTKVREAITLTPDITALKEHDARVLEDAANEIDTFGFYDAHGGEPGDQLRRMASELRRKK